MFRAVLSVWSAGNAVILGMLVEVVLTVGGTTTDAVGLTVRVFVVAVIPVAGQDLRPAVAAVRRQIQVAARGPGGAGRRR